MHYTVFMKMELVSASHTPRKWLCTLWIDDIKNMELNKVKMIMKEDF